MMTNRVAKQSKHDVIDGQSIRTDTPGKQLHKNAKLFLESVSIRGCARISRTNSQFIRLLWIVFLIVTSIILCISVSGIISEYLKYAINEETFIKMDQPSEFPAITFCNHQPFSAEAYRAWTRGNIQSPTQYNNLLRKKASEKLRRPGKKNNAGGYGKSTNSSTQLSMNLGEAYAFVFDFDSLQTYYQNLDLEDAELIGHKRNQSLHMCFFRLLNQHLVYGSAGCYDHNVDVSLHSDPRHFNCFTIQFKQPRLLDIQEIGLVIWLGPKEDYDVQHRQAFIQDVFEQAQGLRVVLHEPGKKAYLEAQGIHIEPGRVNELMFDAIRYKGQQSPRNPCLIEPKHNYYDLESKYSYEFDICLDTFIQSRIIEDCKCMLATLPRIYKPNETMPYCGRMIDRKTNEIDEQGVLFRRRCAAGIMGQSAQLKREFETEGLCNRRCDRVVYRSTASITRWNLAAWQLYWSQSTTSSMENSEASRQAQEQAFQVIGDYLQRENLSNIGDKASQYQSLANKHGLDDQFTMLVVRRKSNDTIVKADNLVLTLNALVSRIGGLCSLYIGMTFAVIIELIEFIYISIWQCNRSESTSEDLNHRRRREDTESPTRHCNKLKQDNDVDE